MLNSFPVNMLTGSCCPARPPTHYPGVEAIGSSIGRSSFRWSQGLPSPTLLSDSFAVGKLRFKPHTSSARGKNIRARLVPSPDVFLRDPVHSNLPTSKLL